MAKKNNNGQRSLFNDETEPKQKSLFAELNSPKTEQLERPHDPDSELLSRLDAMSVSELESEVRKHNELYNQGKPVIADLTYDMLVQKLRDLQADNPVADELTSPEVSSVSRGKVIHHIPMLSIRKPDIRMVFDEIETWLDSFDGDVMATPKIDGLACSLVYDENGNLQIASTRGNGNIGENITANVRYIDAIPKHINAVNLEVRGEVYMPLDAFEAFEGDKISARNLAVGGLKQKDPKETAKYHLSFFAYETVGGDFDTDGMKFDALEKLGFTVPEHHIIKRNQDLRQLRLDIEAFCHDMTEQRRTWNFDADGVVFKVDDNKVQKEMGATAHHPRCAIAYKFPCMEQETTLREVRWQVAKGAAITPVAIFDTVELAGAMVQKASLSNAGMVMNFPLGKDDPEQGKNSKPVHLKIGSRLLVSRRGDVIPHVEYVVSEPEGAVEVEIPHICPSCGGPTKLEGLFLKCMTPDDCPATGQALIENYTKVVGILGFGEKIIENLYDASMIETPADLYRLSVKDIAMAISSDDNEKYDPNAILPTKLYDSIQSMRKLPLAKFLESLSIPSLGHVNSQLLAQLNTLDRVRNATPEDIMTIKVFSAVQTLQEDSDTELTDALLKKYKITVHDRTELLKHFTNIEGLKSASFETIRDSIANDEKKSKKTAISICNGLKNRKKVIDDLLQYVVIDEDALVTNKAMDTPFTNKTFLFTGSLEHMKREEAQARVEALGGKTATGVSKTLSVLVATSQTSTKWRKAQELNEKGANIALWNEEKFLAELEKAEQGNNN